MLFGVEGRRLAGTNNYIRQIGIVRCLPLDDQCFPSHI